jgi:hypothetical protein
MIFSNDNHDNYDNHVNNDNIKTLSNFIRINIVCFNLFFYKILFSSINVRSNIITEKKFGEISL